MTPLGPTEWSFEEWSGQATLRPSIGNWQWPCRSHYWITAGEVEWAGDWSTKQVERGRRAEDDRRRAYFESRKRSKNVGMFGAIWNWLKRLFARRKK